MQGFGIRLPKGEDKFGKGEDVSAIREGENKIRDGVLKKASSNSLFHQLLKKKIKLLKKHFPFFFNNQLVAGEMDSGRSPATH